MELLNTLMLIGIVCIGLTKYFSYYLDEPNRISGSMVHHDKWPLVIFWCAIIIISGFRYGFCDTGVYRNMHNKIGTDWASATKKDADIPDVGFNLLMIFLNRMGLDGQMLILFTALVTFTIYGIYIYKYSTDVPYSLILFLLVSYFTMINGIRQVLAAAVIFLGLPCLRDRKFLPYAVLVLLASTLHASAIIMLPLYIVISGKRLNIGMWIFYGCLMMFFAVPSFATAILGNLLEDSAYSKYLEMDSQMGVTRLMVAAVPAIIAIIYSYVEYRNAINIEGYRSKDRLTDVLINMQLISFGFTALGLRMVYFARLSMYLDGGFMLLLPRAIMGSFNDISAKYVKFISIVLYSFYFVYQVSVFNQYGHFNDFRLNIK